MDSSARVLGECSTLDEAMRRLRVFADQQRKELAPTPGQDGAFVLRGYSQYGGHDQRFGYAARTSQRVLVEFVGTRWRLLIWPETEERVG